MALCACGDTPGSKPPTSATAALKALDSIERLLDAGKTADALRAAESLQRSMPEDAMAAEMLGRALMAAGGSADRIADAYALAADLRPDSPGLQSSAGITAAAAGREPQALVRHWRACGLEPGNPQHPMHAADMLRALHRPKDALPYAQRAATLAPLDPSVQLCLSRCLAATGDLTQARAAAMQALQASPKDVPLRIAVTQLLIEQNAPDDAVRVIQLEAERPAAGAEVLECLASAQTAAGLHALAAATWQRRASMPLAPWQPCLHAAECLQRSGDRQQALDWLARARERRAPEAAIKPLETELSREVTGGSAK